MLHWVGTPSHLLKTFASNRVSEIQKLTTPDDWRHIRSEQNTTDLISRGPAPTDIIRNQFWQHDPEWLKGSEERWPKAELESGNIPEQRTIKVAISLLNNALRTLRKCRGKRMAFSNLSQSCSESYNETSLLKMTDRTQIITG